MQSSKFAKQALCFLYDGFDALQEDLLEKVGKFTMNVTRMRTSFVKVLKMLNNLNLSSMNDLFKLKENIRLIFDKCKLNLDISKWNQNNNFGYKILKVLGRTMSYEVI